VPVGCRLAAFALGLAGGTADSWREGLAAGGGSTSARGRLAAFALGLAGGNGGVGHAAGGSASARGRLAAPVLGAAGGAGDSSLGVEGWSRLTSRANEVDALGILPMSAAAPPGSGARRRLTNTSASPTMSPAALAGVEGATLDSTFSGLIRQPQGSPGVRLSTIGSSRDLADMGVGQSHARSRLR